MLCRPCHDLTLSDADECIAIGWVIERRSGADPLEVPAKIYTVNGYGWWHLTEDGGYRWDDELNLQQVTDIVMWNQGYKIENDVM